MGTKNPPLTENKKEVTKIANNGNGHQGFSQKDLFAAFDTYMKKVAIELFRINGGKQGYYIADIQDKKYYGVAE